MINRILVRQVFERLLGAPVEANPIVKEFNRTDLRMDLNTTPSSRLWFGSLEEPEMAEGPSVDAIHIDEARLVRHFSLAWQVCQRRLRGSRPGNRVGAWITTTPDMPGSDLFNEFENPKTRNPLSKIYRFSIDANKDNLPPGYIENIKRSHTGGLAERFVHGRFARAGEGNFPFDSAVHIKDVDPKFLHTIRYGVDFGWTNPSAIIVIAHDSDNRVYALDEFYQSQTHTETLIKELKDFAREYGSGPIFCDKTSPETIEVIRHAGLPAEPYANRREDGLRELGGRFLIAGDGKPRIYISNRCANLINELFEYNEAVKERDHAVDALRYALLLRPPPDLEAFRLGLT
jgi:hypothetical protein